MFTNLENLDSERHRKMRFKPVADCRFAASLSSAPLSATEVVEAAKHYPLVFPAEAPILPMALFSLKDGANTFIDAEGKWLASYVPAHVRRYPFILGNTDKPDNYTVMLAIDAPHFSDPKGEPLYTKDGEMSEVLSKAVEFLKLFQGEVAATEKLLAPLADSGVLTTQRIDLARADGTTKSFDGVRAVDREKLKALDDATLAEWVRGGLMAVVHAHLSSLGNFKALAERQDIGEATKH